MRTTYGLLLVSLLLFVFGMWFALAGARARPAGGPPAAAPVASVLEVMDGIVSPAAGVVYASVGTVVTREGTIMAVSGRTDATLSVTPCGYGTRLSG